MIQNLEELIRHESKTPKRLLAVAAAQDDAVLLAVEEARAQGLCNSILVGDRAKICEILQKIGANSGDYEIIDAHTPQECAEKAVALVVAGKADFMMKGLLNTSDLMRAVIDREKGLRTNMLISHVMLYQIPSLPRLIYMTDGGMNTYPNLEQKADILENAATVSKAMGMDKIHAACICGAETVSPKIQATVDASALANMSSRFDKYNMVVAGPMGFDLAISDEACQHKGYENEVGGRADIVLVPTYEVGNGIGKALTYFADAKSAGIIVGAKCPIVLVSRADTAETKLASIALGKILV